MTKQVRDHFVYRLYNANGELLYVGCTKRLKNRWQTHKAERPGMVAETVRCRLQGPYTYVKAREIERVAIRTEEPLIGFTPTRNREKRARIKWANQRTAEIAEELSLTGDPNYMYRATELAWAEAEEWFPDPDEHERAYRRGENPLSA